MQQIESGAHERQGHAITNFERVLPLADVERARQALKDPYIFDFLSLADEACERDLERALVRDIQSTLIELGAGSAFVGRQVRLEVGDDAFFVDMLFYQLKLRCYVVVELEAGEFRPEHVGKLNVYLSAVDDSLRDPAHDQPSIGLLLCRSKERVVAEYALRDMGKPIGVAAIEHTRLLPHPFREALGELRTLIEQSCGRTAVCCGLPSSSRTSRLCTHCGHN